MGFVPSDKSFLKLLRKKTNENKSLLIFDEVMTGFRVSLGGAQEIYGIKPDITTLGKVIGGGLPVGAFGGKGKIMDYLAPNGPVYQAGTLSGNPLAMAAGSTLIKLLVQSNPYKNLELKASNLLDQMKDLFHNKGIPFSTNQIGGMFGFFFSQKLPNNLRDVENSNDTQFKKFLNKCMTNGIYFAPSKFEAGFISTKHTNKEINHTISVVKKILDEGI
jgi:glutamate-1-semialdehyde 2,1-aminomutase